MVGLRRPAQTARRFPETSYAPRTAHEVSSERPFRGEFSKDPLSLSPGPLPGGDPASGEASASRLLLPVRVRACTWSRRGPPRGLGSKGFMGPAAAEVRRRFYAVRTQRRRLQQKHHVKHAQPKAEATEATTIMLTATGVSTESQSKRNSAVGSFASGPWSHSRPREAVVWRQAVPSLWARESPQVTESQYATTPPQATAFFEECKQQASFQRGREREAVARPIWRAQHRPAARDLGKPQNDRPHSRAFSRPRASGAPRGKTSPQARAHCNESPRDDPARGAGKSASAALAKAQRR